VKPMQQDWKTTLIGLGQAIVIGLIPLQIFELTPGQKAWVVVLAVLQAAFGYFARDTHK
jgi:hypothetical protein